MPLVSIGLPAYNGEDYLEVTLNSLLSQTYTNFELIICDDVSTDSTESICRKFEHADSRIRYFRNSTNIGGFNNFNQVFNLAQGEFFMWAAHDDLWDRTFIEKCVEKLAEYPSASAVYSRVRCIDRDGVLLPDEIVPAADSINLSIMQRISSCSLFIYGLFRSSFVKKTRLLTATYGSDIVFTLELALVGDILLVDEVLLFYRMFVGESSRSLSDQLKNFPLTDGQRQEIERAPVTHIAKELMNAIKIAPLDEHTKEELKRGYALLLSGNPRFYEQIPIENKDFFEQNNGISLYEFIQKLA